MNKVSYYEKKLREAKAELRSADYYDHMGDYFDRDDPHNVLMEQLEAMEDPISKLEGRMLDVVDEAKALGDADVTARADLAQTALALARAVAALQHGSIHTYVTYLKQAVDKYFQ